MIHPGEKPIRPIAPRGSLAGIALASVIAFAAYANSLLNGYVYDDVEIVQENPNVTDADRWREIWGTDYWAHARQFNPDRDLLYRPLTISSFRSINSAFGSSPFWQHLVNVLLHALNSALVVVLARRLKLPHISAGIAGVLFAVLPIHAEAVNEIVGRADLLATCGVMLALLFQDLAFEATSLRVIVARLTLMGIAMVAAMASKESGIAAPALVILWLAFRQPHQPQTQIKKVMRGIIAVTLAATALYLGLRYFALDGRLYQKPGLTKTVNALVDSPPWQRALGVLQLWGMYWEKTIYPRVLCISYSITQINVAKSLFHFHVLLGIAVGIVLAGASIFAWRRGNRIVALVVLSLVICYLPTANAITLIQVFFAERIWYLPSIWVVILLAMLIAKCTPRPIAIAALAIIAALMTVRCWIRNSEWRDNAVLFASCMRDHPNSIRCQYAYGLWLVDHGNLREGIELLQRARSIDLGFTDANWALGYAYAKLGDAATAIQYIQLTEMQQPLFPGVHRLRRELEAYLAAHTETEANPLWIEAQRTAGTIENELELIRKLRERGMITTVLRRFESAPEDFKNNSQWHYEYGVTFMVQGKTQEALEHYRESLRLDPSNAQIKIELAMVLISIDQEKGLSEAAQLSGQAVAERPQLAGAYVCRAEVLVLQGKINDAVDSYKAALERVPAGDSMREVYLQRMKSLGE